MLSGGNYYGVHRYDVFEKLRRLAVPGSTEARPVAAYTAAHDELLARQAVFAISIGRLMDGIELSATGLRLRLAHSLGLPANEDHPQLLIVPRRVLVRCRPCAPPHVDVS